MWICSSTTEADSTGPGRSFWPGLLLLGLCVLAYAPSLGFGFVYDDEPQIRDNRFLERASLWEVVRSPVWEGVPGTSRSRYVRPVFSAFLWAGKQLFGNEPWKWRVAVLGVHVLVCWLALWLISRLTGSAAAAGWGAALFAVHPVHTESVAWVSGATDPLAMLFVLLAGLGHVRFRTRGGAAWCLASFVCLALALLAKEVVLAYPIWLAGAEFLGSSEGGPQARRRAAISLAGAACVVLAWIGWRFWKFDGFGWAPGPKQMGPVLGTAVQYAGFYLRHLFFAYPLAPVYPATIQRHVDAALLASGLLVAVAWGGLLLGGWRRPRWRAVGWWAAAFLLPYVNPGPFEVEDALHDRYLYVASFGVCAWLGLLLGHFKPAGRALLGSSIVALALGSTWSGLDAYSSNLALFTRAAWSFPDSTKFLTFLGGELDNQGRKQEAEIALRRALSLNRRYPRALLSLGTLEYEKGHLPKAYAYQQLAVSLMPGNALAWKQLGDTLLAMKRREPAYQAYLQAVETDPAFHAARWSAAAEALLKEPPDLEAARWLLSSVDRNSLQSGDRKRYLQLRTLFRDAQAGAQP